jgi:hypothetical protein
VCTICDPYNHEGLTNLSSSGHSIWYVGNGTIKKKLHKASKTIIGDLKLCDANMKLQKQIFEWEISI